MANTNTKKNIQKELNKSSKNKKVNLNQKNNKTTPKNK